MVRFLGCCCDCSSLVASGKESLLSASKAAQFLDRLGIGSGTPAPKVYQEWTTKQLDLLMAEAKMTFEHTQDFAKTYTEIVGGKTQSAVHH